MVYGLYVSDCIIVGYQKGCSGSWKENIKFLRELGNYHSWEEVRVLYGVGSLVCYG